MVYFDETTDMMGRYIVNLLVGVLKNDVPTKPYLISCKELDKTNYSTVSRFINNSLKTLWPAGAHDEKVLLMLSDAAPYMIKTGEALKVFYPNITHVTCLAHMLNRIAEKVREIHPNVNTLINNIKKSFLKLPSRVQMYREELPGVPLPPEPVITRWGTWIEAVIFNTDHYLGIKTVIGNLNNDSSASVEKCRQMFMLDSVKNDMIFIKSHFTDLVKAITNLEQSNLTLVESLQIVQTVLYKLTNIPGEKGNIIKTKVTQLCEKNKGYQMLEKVGNILSGNNENLPEHFTPSVVADMKFAPLTSVDVERSFSHYKHILSDRRTNMSSENIEKYIIINLYNKI
jgi:hypothetical protein